MRRRAVISAIVGAMVYVGSVAVTSAHEHMHSAPVMNMAEASDAHYFIQIIPNWHAVLVHFPVALLITAAGLFVASTIMRKKPVAARFYQAAQYNLWLGTLAALVAVATGWYAYNTVVHDDAGHAAMTIHMKWAIGTLVVAVLASLATKFSYKNRPTILLLVLVLLAGGAAAVTGYLGGENVYRNGIGVMRMPDMIHSETADH